MRLLVVPCLLLAGCSPRPMEATPQQAHAPVHESEPGQVIVLAVDLSGSFIDRMAEQGEAYKFCTMLIDRYFRDRIGTDDRMVIAQLSGTKRSLLWEGRPLELRQQFPSAAEFRDHLITHKDDSGSLIYEGLRHATEYLMSDPNVRAGKAKPGLFVLSDMLDTQNDPQVEGYLNHQLSELGHYGGVVGIYYVDQERVVEWRSRLAAMNIDSYCVEGDFVGNPPLPVFDD